MDPAKVTAIQNWWRRLCQFRCRKCGDVYSGEWICNECYMDRHEDDIPDDLLMCILKEREEKKRQRQEKKRSLGLILDL